MILQGCLFLPVAAYKPASTTLSTKSDGTASDLNSDRTTGFN